MKLLNLEISKIIINTAKKIPWSPILAGVALVGVEILSESVFAPATGYGEWQTPK